MLLAETAERGFCGSRPDFVAVCDVFDVLHDGLLGARHGQGIKRRHQSVREAGIALHDDMHRSPHAGPAGLGTTLALRVMVSTDDALALASIARAALVALDALVAARITRLRRHLAFQVASFGAALLDAAITAFATLLGAAFSTATASASGRLSAGLGLCFTHCEQ